MLKYLEKIKNVCESRGNKDDYYPEEIKGIYKQFTLICLNHGHIYNQLPCNYIRREGCKYCIMEMLADEFDFRRVPSDATIFDWVFKKCKKCKTTLCCKIGRLVSNSDKLCVGCHEEEAIKDFIKKTKYAYDGARIFNNYTFHDKVYKTLSKNGQMSEYLEILGLLQNYDVLEEYIRQYCKPIKNIPKSFHIFIPRLKVYIECPGKHHYKVIPLFGGINDVLKRISSDLMKINFVLKKRRNLMIVSSRKQFKHKFLRWISNKEKISSNCSKSVLVYLRKILNFLSSVAESEEVIELKSEVNKILSKYYKTNPIEKILRDLRILDKYHKTRPLEKIWNEIKKLDENHLEKLLLMFPTKHWDWDKLSGNPNITMDFIRRNLDCPWNWREISKNPNLTCEFIEANMDQKWDWSYFGFHTATLDFIQKYEDRLFLDDLYCNKNVTVDFIKKTPELEWNGYNSCGDEPEFPDEYLSWSMLSENPNITCDFIEKNMDKSWNWGSLSSNPIITSDFVEKNLDKDWDWIELSKYVTIDRESFGRNVGQEWEWIWLTSNPSITWDIVKDHLNEDWDWCYLSEHPNITWEIVEKTMDTDERINWNLVHLTRNPNTTWESVQKYLDKIWDWEWLTINPHITFDIINKNLDKRWSLKHILFNPNVTWDIVVKSPEVNWKKLSENLFNKNPVVAKTNRKRKAQYYRSILSPMFRDLMPIEIIFYLAEFV